MQTLNPWTVFKVSSLKFNVEDTKPGNGIGHQVNCFNLKPETRNFEPRLENHTMRCFLALLAIVTAVATAREDNLVLVAGGGDGPDGSDASKAKLIQPFGVDFAPDGTIYVVEMAKGE